MGGFDLLGHTIWYTADSTMPAWGLLFTFPFRWIPYPATWYIWVFLSIIITGMCMRIFGTQSRLLSVALSYSMIYGVWFGQTEALILVGVVLGWLVTQRKIHSAFMGIAWMLMLIKPQVAVLAVILFAFWLIKDKRHRDLLYAAIAACAILLLSVAIWSQWIPNYITMSTSYIAPDINGTIWPIGIVAIPLMMLPRLSRITRLRMALVVNLLASPYLQSYHTVVSLAVSGSVLGALISWLPFVVGNLNMSWIVPIIVLVSELVSIRIKKGLTWHTFKNLILSTQTQKGKWITKKFQKDT